LKLCFPSEAFCKPALRQSNLHGGLMAQAIETPGHSIEIAAKRVAEPTFSSHEPSASDIDVLASGAVMSPSAAHFQPVLSQWVPRKLDSARLRSLSKPKVRHRPIPVAPDVQRRPIDEEWLRFISTPRNRRRITSAAPKARHQHAVSEALQSEA